MNPSTGIEKDPSPASQSNASPEVSQSWKIVGMHFRLTQLVFEDGTDTVNELVHEREWLLHPRETPCLHGNLFCLENLSEGGGSWFVQPAPLPGARPGETPYDFRISLKENHAMVEVTQTPGGHSWERLDWTGGDLEWTRILHEWQQGFRPEAAVHQIPAFLSNTWGDRSRDGRMREDFILTEIEAAAEVGVDIVQLDDGWQRGITSNSVHADQGGVWEGFWNQNPKFWTPHPERFPRGLEPLVEAARAHGVRLGLWFAPDSWNDFVHWERDAACVIDLHRRHGICAFKLDGIKAHSETALKNLRGFVARVLHESGGEVVFDLDITAETRPGYFGMMNCGPLFVENRYTDWHVYWPHHTLRTLWKLSRWIDPRRLRMEFLNPERNTGLYGDDPLAPAKYRLDTLFASVMFANPLGWFEVSGLSKTARRDLGAITRVWNAHREALFAGAIIPIGSCPTGYNFSGFLSVPRDVKAPVYVVLFRGDTREGEFSIELPDEVAMNGKLKILHGDGHAQISGKQLKGEIASPLGFVFASS
ncbi:MAG: alpha-galactosidase [Verrucomicrobia bacterium]|nr:alpha-galactosidase [Verrucomicrobiota bacterium]MCH8511284.1 alpha-galactosidase [Kiritimatiellia bacterium]